MNFLRAAVILLMCVISARAEWRPDYSLRGYVRETPIYWKPPPYLSDTGERRFDNILHARLNGRLYPASRLRIGAELKTRIFTGESAQEMRQQADISSHLQPYFRLSRTFSESDHAIWTGSVDRLWLQWEPGPLTFTAGRQRVAWGTNWVWNPTDVFNPSSPFDFDNEEKPGADAVRAEWYLGPNSVLDAAFAPQEKADSSVAAARLKVNRWEYDWIVLAGRRGPTTVAGFAWAGHIRGGGFRGEILYTMLRAGSGWRFMFPPFFSFIEEHKDNLTAAISGDYTFPSSLYLHGEVLYNEHGTTDKAGGVRQVFAFLKGDLTPARLSLFGEVAQDLSPLVRASVAGILNPYDLSWYAGPTVSWSVITNLDVVGAGLIFGGDEYTEFGDAGEMLMARIKWSF
ncbi:hypothetical protein KKH27_09975 [bacterium]|nr:hypothetical protein [bacterium]MBU1984877.1 hypothetical protein [bacterium]